MRTAPVLRGGPVLTGVWLVVGLFLFACGIVCFLESRLGLPPWDVLHQGIAEHSPLSFGEANIVVSVFVVTFARLLGARVGIGTLANAVLVGTFIVALTSIGAVQELADQPLAVRIGMLVAGVLLTGAGSGIYLAAALGAGPRDSLMVIAAYRLGRRIAVVRAGIELCALGLGIALGGTFGAGTVAFALLIGPSIEASFWLLERSRLTRPVCPAPVPA